MIDTPLGNFDLRALYVALDAQRAARALTWAAARRQINAVGDAPSIHPIAASTIAGLRNKRLAEANGVLQMLRWLGRSPESFVAGSSPELAASAPLPTGVQGVFRFDTRRLFAALDEKRDTRGLTWDQMARETGVPASHAKGLARGGRTAFPAVMRLTGWLGRPASDFVRLTSV